MQQIPLNAVPSQDLSIQLDGEYWRIKLSLSMEFVCATISRDGDTLISGIRCFVNQPLLPYPYMYEPRFGNFLFDTDVDWENFGGSCSLYYLNASEMAEYNALIKQGYADSAIKMMNNRAAKFAAEAAKIPSDNNVVLTEIISQPVDTQVQVGDTATFTCDANKWVSAAWEYSPRSDYSAWKIIQEVTGGSALTLDIPNVDIHKTGFYRAVVFGDNNTVTSDIVELRLV